MKKNLTRIICIVLAAILCLGLLAGIIPASAADLVTYRTGTTGKYSNVIYNWGNRGEEATFLSPNAEEFYADNNVTYEQLALLSGSSNLSSVGSSALYLELQELMQSNHKTINSYDDNKNLAAFTDCQNNGNHPQLGNKISSFYSGIGIGPSWDGEWNREHTWPNSKGDDSGQGENDVMMIRPTASSENSSRGNTAYGQSSGYYDPNDKSNGTLNLHGDVARIMLYVYVRWGNTRNMWGSSGVIESKDVLLQWIEEDPVDTWELARNDSVESITGTRNVFVDYPELAFNLFNEGVPSDLITPSGSAAGVGYEITAQVSDAAQGSVEVKGRVINVKPAEGYAFAGYELLSGTAEITRDGNRLVVNASSDCTIQVSFAAKTPTKITFTMNGIEKGVQDVYIGDTVVLPGHMATVADGYTFAGWVDADVAPGSAKPANIYAAGTSYTVTGEMTLKALYAFFDTNASEGTAFAKYTGELTEGDYLLTYNEGALTASVNSGNRLDYTDVTVAGNAIEAPDASLIWTVGKEADGAYTLYNASTGKYAAGTTVNNKGTLLESVTDYAKWTVTGNATYDFVNGGNSRYLRRNEAYGFACYSNQTGGALTLYKRSSGSSVYSTAIEGWTPEDLTITSIPDAIAIGSAQADNTFTADKYYVTGIVTSVESTIYGNLYIADEQGNQLKIYGIYDATGTNRYDALPAPPAVGDTVTLLGVLGSYAGAAEMKNAWLIGHEPGDGSNLPDIPVVDVTVVDAPVAGTAYKFGMAQGNLNNKVFYLTGAMSNFYMGTTEAPESAMDVYLEETTGGYYFYGDVSGARKYINMVATTGTDGKEHVNGVYGDAPVTVYTYDTENKTLVATINDTLYWLGTRDDKEYTTMGPCVVEYGGFYGRFYELGEGGGSVTPPPVNPPVIPDPEEPEQPTGATAQLMTQLPVAGDVVVIYNSGMAMTATNNGGKLAGQTAALSGDLLPLTETMAQLTVAMEGEHYVFTLDGKYLTSATTGNGLSFEEQLTDCGKWTIEATGTNAWIITCVGATYNGTDYNQALETYNGNFTTYGVKDTDIYKMQLFQVVEEEEEPAKNGWVQENGKWFFYEDGEMIKNAWRQDSKGWCFLGADGAMLTNQWKKDSKGWCYIGSSGYIVYSKWVKDSTGWCYVGAAGYMVYNKWVKDSKGWCYVGADGYMVYNKWVKDSIGWCYVGADGYMVYNKWVKDSIGWCYVDGSGYMVYNKWVKDSIGWCYVDASGYMVYNKWVADSKGWCYVDGSGYMVTNGWAKDSLGWYWMGADGYAIKNTSKTIGGKTYYFNASGLCTNP